MALRACSMAFGLAVLLNVTHITFGYSAAVPVWRQCWVTESGLGVCVPSPVASRRQPVLITRRH